MTTDITILESKYREFKHEFAQDDIDHLLEANSNLEAEIKRLRKDKEQLHEQIVLMKKLLCLTL